MAQISIGSNLYVTAERFGFRPQFKDGLRGFLHKQGHRVKNWKLRYFVLDPSSLTLCYYTDETTQQLQGEWISRTSVVHEKGDSMDDRDHIIELNASRFSGENDKLYLSARSAEDKKKWILAIDEVICGGNIKVTQPDLWDRFSVEFYMKVTLQDSSPEPQLLMVDSDLIIVDVSSGPSVPRFSFPSKGMSGSSYYTMVVLDMDYPSRDCPDRRLYLMQLKVNLSDTSVLGYELLDYQVPAYIDGSLHRIFFVVFAQQGYIIPNSEQSTDRDFFQPREFAKEFGMTRPVAIEGCYFTQKSSSAITGPSISQTTDYTSSLGSSSLSCYSSPAQRRHKKLKYFSQHANRASLTLDNVSNHIHDGNLNGNVFISPSSSVAPSIGVAKARKITQLSDEAQLDHYLALPVPPDIPTSRDTSTASTTTVSSHKRVSFLSSTASLTAGSNKPLAPVLKRPGSKKLDQKKTVSFVSNEIQYVATNIPLEVEMDVYAADDDAPDYDTGFSGCGKVGSSPHTNAFGLRINRERYPSYKHTPKSISVNTNRMVADSFPDYNPANNDEGTCLLLASGTGSKRSNSFHLGMNQQCLIEASSVYEGKDTCPSAYIINTSEESSETESLKEIVRPTVDRSNELCRSFKELLGLAASDVQSACRFFRVSDKNIFVGETFTKKYSTDYTYKNSFVWIHVPMMRIYWAKSQADKDIAGRNKYLSLEPPDNESFLANSNGSKGSVQSVTQPDKNALILVTRDCQSLTIKSARAERIEEWLLVLNSILTQTQPS